MKSVRKWLAALLAAAMVMSLLPMAYAQEDTRVNTWSDQLFTDVSPEDWFYEDVKNVYELGLMAGYGDGIFGPVGDITLAQTVAIAARLHSIYETGTATFEQGNPWYQVYVDYAMEKGILTVAPKNYMAKATRLEFASILAKALPEEALPAINDVKDGQIPDLKDHELIYRLYRAGVLMGSDAAGTFHPNDTITRRAVAAIAARMGDPALREEFTLKRESSGGTSSSGSRPSSGNSSGGDVVVSPSVEDGAPAEGPYDENNALTAPYDQLFPEAFNSGAVEYSGEQILVKLPTTLTADQRQQLTGAGVAGLREIMTTTDGKWYKAAVSDGVTEVMAAVRRLPFVLLAEYDYAYSADSMIECNPEDLDELVHGNKQFNEQWYLRSCGLKKGWDHIRNPHHRPGYDEDPDDGGEDGASDGEIALTGGGSGIVVAVIDTGVDYTHEDLKDNIWINDGETPNNGIDDDGNGYIDDYYGYNAVTGKGSGMDDHGHGTHVAGIIAASNNNLGIVGLAYNAKIMPIKAGMASGYFNQSDIAEAILYAYKNGADVINMSFGGSASTILVQDALETAYTRCVLVAAAGNDGKPNEMINNILPQPNYPASLAYVLGVMSVDQYGVESSFTNWDAIGFNSVEYEVYAPGDQMISTIPGNRYATWSGTSMAAPVVSGMAALLREEFRDPNTYPTKFIYGQLAGTGDTYATCLDPEQHGLHNLPKIVDIYNALTVMPKPQVGVTEHTYFDTAGLKGNTKNNGDGIVDAGETIALGFELRNRWGMSEDTVITVDTLSPAGLPDPYVTIHNNDVNYGSVGTYSTQDAGKVKDGDVWVGWEKPIYITVSPDCPNDYIFKLNVTVSCKNALDIKDTTKYTSSVSITVDVRRGVILPSIIEEDMTLTADNYYIIPNSCLIPAGVTVTVEPGTQIQFWSDDPNDAYAETAIVALNVEGTLLVNGEPDNRCRMFPSERMLQYRVEINEKNNGLVKLHYADVVNLYSSNALTYAEGCEFSQSFRNEPIYYRSLSGTNVVRNSSHGSINVKNARDCSFYKLGGGSRYYKYYVAGHYDGCIFVDSAIQFSDGYYNWYKNCVFYGNNNYLGEATGANSELTVQHGYYGIREMFIDSDTQTRYVSVDLSSIHDSKIYGNKFPYHIAQKIAEHMGGHLARIETREEYNFLYNQLNDYVYLYWIGLTYDEEQEAWLWEDGSEPGDFLPTSEVTGDGEGTTWAARDKKIYLGTEEAGFALVEIPYTYVDEITLNRYAVELDTEEGSGWQIMAEVAPAGAAGAQLGYESLDETVAIVDETGFVTPVGTGTATIRVWSPDRYVYNTLTVTVVDAVPLQSIDLGEDFALEVGESRQLNAVLVPENTTKPNLTWTSSSSAVSVSNDGKVTARREGTAVITATNPNTGVFDTVEVSAYIPVEDVVVEETLFATHYNTEETVDVLGVQVLPADATYPELIWESSNPEILDVDDEGNLIKGGKGSATLRATSQETGQYVEVTVCLADVPEETTVVETAVIYWDDDRGFIALLDDGTMWHWGTYQNMPVRLPFENVETFALGRIVDSTYTSKYLALVDREGNLNVYCTGYDDPIGWKLDNSALGGSPASGVVKVICAGYNFVYLKENGTVWGWGKNYNGILGIGNDVAQETAVQTQISETVTDIGSSYSGGLTMLTDQGDIYCAGYLRDGSTESHVPVLYASGVEEIHSVYNRVNLIYPDMIKTDAHSSDVSERLGEKMWLSGYQSFYVDEEGTLFGKGTNGYGQLGIGTTSNASDYQQVKKVRNVTDVFVHDARFTSAATVFIQTADGKFYGTGSASGAIPLYTGNQTIPIQIYFGLEVDETSPEVMTTNLEEDVLNEDQLVLDFDDALLAGENYYGVSLEGSNGQALSIVTDLKLDKYTVAPFAGFVPGETYTLTIPAAALTNRYEVANEKFELVFTVAESAEEPEEEAAEEGEETVEEIPEVESVSQQEVLLLVEDGEVHETQINPEAPERELMTEEKALQLITDWDDSGINHVFYNNAILNRLVDDNMNKWLRIRGKDMSAYSKTSVTGNYWGTTSPLLVEKQIVDFDDFNTLENLNQGEILTAVPENLWPVVVRTGLLDKDGNEVNVIGNETVTFFVEFNRDMDTTLPLDVRFGSSYPYADYQVDGDYVSERRWEGTTTLTTIIENGYQYWSINNGCAADHAGLKLYKDWGRFEFEIDTTEAMAMLLQGQATKDGVRLAWTQDDFDTLSGYNVYRATKDEDAYYQKLNAGVIPADTKQFFDETVEPGQVYYYIFTVVKTDLTESEPSGKIMIQSMDTMAPLMYHTPVYQGYENKNVVISATVTDNLELAWVRLYYRSGTDGVWKNVEMTALNDEYSAIIPGSSLVAEQDIVYYIVASDGVTSVNRGTAENPYTIVVQADPGEQMLGDVDDNGRINLRDALLVLRARNNKVVLTAEQFARADIDADGKLSAAEALTILQYANGVIGSLK